MKSLTQIPCRMASILLMAAVLPALSAAQPAPAPQKVAGTPPAATISTDEGILQITIPAGWEINRNLAKDNGVLGFLNPLGMKPGQEIPMWLLVDRRDRAQGESFAAALRRIMDEGKQAGFVLRDSTTIAATNGRQLKSYGFQPSSEKHERAIAFLETPQGLFLFRYQASTIESWKQYKEGVDIILKSVMFQPKE